MTTSMIEQSVERLFGSQVGRKQLEAFEAGQWPRALWAQVSDHGYPKALAAEQAGGISLGFDEAFPIFRGIGFWQVPLPLADTMIASLLLTRAGLDTPDGPIALIEASHQPGLSVRRVNGVVKIEGRARSVSWAPHCQWALVSDSRGELALIELAERPGLRIEAGANIAREPRGHLEFDAIAATVSADNPLPALTEPVRVLGALVRSIMIAGALESALAQSVRYANERVQFGRAIGQNQAVQQSLALLAGDAAAVKTAARVAAQAAPGALHRGTDTLMFDVAVAKIRAGEAATRATSIAHQVHGAIGYTYEHSLNYATRRLWAWRQEFGTDAWWAGRLGQAAIRARAAKFWPGVVSRRLRW